MRAATLCVIALVAVGCGEDDEASGGASTESPTDESSSAVDELVALGYGGWDDKTEAQPAPAARHDPKRVMPWPRAWANDRSLVHVVDTDGAIARTIEVPGRTQVEFARFLEGGRIACLSVDEGLTLLEPDGSVVWHFDAACHHDVTVVPDGRPPLSRVLALAVHGERVWRGRRVRFDEVVFVDESTGRTTDTVAPWSTFDAREALLERSGGPHPLDRPLGPSEQMPDTVYDYFHLNAISFEGSSRMLVCLRNIDLVTLVDLESRTLGESIGPGVLDWPHAPIPVGEVGSRTWLVFDNGKHRGWSRAVQLEPGTGEVVWQYGGRSGQVLFSELRGLAQRLPNGNTLITESERGRVLEVSADGELVWEFWNPEIRESSGSSARRRIYRMMAVPPADAGLVPTKKGR